MFIQDAFIKNRWTCSIIRIYIFIDRVCTLFDVILTCRGFGLGQSIVAYSIPKGYFYSVVPSKYNVVSSNVIFLAYHYIVGDLLVRTYFCR